MEKIIRLLQGVFVLIIVLIAGCQSNSGTINKTSVTIKGDRWFFNNKIINEGSPAEGLLINVRMVNSVFEDIGKNLPDKFKNFDSEKNVDSFISKIPEYVDLGVNGFTISLQGGAPGYEGAVNSAFESDGSLRPEYLNRVTKVIRAADENSAVVILSCFYQRQHSHSSALNGREAIQKALSNTVKWIKKNNFRNVVLEVSNEYRHGGYRNWQDGKWLISTKGQMELLTLVKSLYPELIVSTSGMGDGNLNDTLAKKVDYITIHFNNTSLEDYSARIGILKKAGKPVLCNEDDKISKAGTSALIFSVINGCGWGYMNSRQNQTMPFRFEGAEDDTSVYDVINKITAPGYSIDESAFTQPSLIITYPKDGDLFKTGQKINIRFSYLFPDTSERSLIRIFSNKNQIGTIETNKNQLNSQLNEAGIFILEAVVTDPHGNELLRSPKVDIIVQDGLK